MVGMEKNPMILVINPGSTSTKVALFKGEELKVEETISHSSAELNRYKHIVEQQNFRKEGVLNFLTRTGFSIASLQCVVGRGGILPPLEGGTYLVNDKMCQDLYNAEKEHASNLGALLAKEIADKLGIPSFIVDPVVVDELEPLARLSGQKGIERRSIFHALNQKAIARKVANQLQKDYLDCDLIVAHLGGGISVGVHHRGRVIDVNNALDGDGPFSPERSGGIPNGNLIKICFQRGLKENEVVKSLVGRGGLVSYLGTNDARLVEEMVRQGDEEAILAYQGMAYQIAKEICGCAAVLKGKVDAVVLTGGLSYSKMLIEWIKERVSFLSPVLVLPGEGEMEALARGALRVIKGEEEYKSYSNVSVSSKP